MGIDRFRAMEVFSKVAELGSFTRAAGALHLPKARATALVQELEAHLGVRLLNRTTRRLSLTEDGAIYLQRAMSLMQDMHEAEGMMRRSVANPAGRLRVDVPAAVGRHVIGPALPSFFSRFPDIVLDLGSSDRPVDLVAEGVDCVVRGGLVHDESLVARHLGQYQVVTCAAPSYLVRYGTPITPDDLTPGDAKALTRRRESDRAANADNGGHRFLNFHSAKTGNGFAFEFARGDDVRELHGPHWVSCNDAGTYLAAGLSGMGLMQTPLTRVVRGHIQRGELVPVLQDWNAGTLPMMILYPRNRHLTAKVRVFCDWVTELYRAEFAALGVKA